MLDFRTETFLCVCKHMNFTKAAEELNLTQPAVSQHIRFLERHYQTKLFAYHNRVLELTPQGQYLKEMAQTLWHDTIRIEENIRLAQKRKRIYLGATLSIGEYYLPQKLPALMRRYPELDFSVTVADTAQLLSLLSSSAVDCVLCEGYFHKSRYGHMLMKKEKMSIFCAADYDCKSITDLPSLFSHPLLIREQGSGTREIFERYLHENNYSLENFQRIHEFTSPHLMVRMLMERQGISVLYHTVGEEQLKAGTLKEIEIPGFQIAHEFNAIWKSNSVFEDQYREMTGHLIDGETI